CDATLAVGDEATTLALALTEVRPNPARTSMAIAYVVPKDAGNITLRVIDPQGRTVRTLASGTHAAGRWTATWDLADAKGDKVRAGVYFIRLAGSAGERVERVSIMR